MLMKMSIMIAVAIGLAAAVGWLVLRGARGSRTNEAANPADAGRELRLMALTASAEKSGLHPDADYPEVYGVLVDWNLGNQTASILAMRGGTASLYTTSTFGIIGGQGHAKVRRAAEVCVKLAGQYYGRGLPVSEFPYPNEGKVHFYLLGYDGVRLSVGDEPALNGGTDPMLPLFAAAQDVLTELRQVSQ
jgi:hypothetical protein